MAARMSENGLKRPHRTSRSWREARARGYPALENLARKLALEFRYTVASTTPEVNRRLRIAAPSLEAALFVYLGERDDTLKRNVSLHSAHVPRADALLRAWRQAQRGPLLGTTRIVKDLVARRPGLRRPRTSGRRIGARSFGSVPTSRSVLWQLPGLRCSFRTRRAVVPR